MIPKKVQSGDKTYKLIKDLSPDMPIGEMIIYDNYLQTCVHVGKENKLTEIPYGFVLNHPEIFELC